MVKMYFTFGSSSDFPHQNTYIVVKGIDRQDCIAAFREKYPDLHENYLNCSFFYNEDAWKERISRYYKAVSPAEILISKRAEDQQRLCVLMEKTFRLFEESFRHDGSRKEFEQELLRLIGTDEEEMRALDVNLGYFEED